MKKLLRRFTAVLMALSLAWVPETSQASLNTSTSNVSLASSEIFTNQALAAAAVAGAFLASFDTPLTARVQAQAADQIPPGVRAQATPTLPSPTPLQSRFQELLDITKREAASNAILSTAAKDSESRKAILRTLLQLEHHEGQSGNAPEFLENLIQRLLKITPMAETLFELIDAEISPSTHRSALLEYERYVRQGGEVGIEEIMPNWLAPLFLKDVEAASAALNIFEAYNRLQPDSADLSLGYELLYRLNEATYHGDLAAISQTRAAIYSRVPSLTLFSDLGYGYGMSRDMVGTIGIGLRDLVLLELGWNDPLFTTKAVERYGIVYLLDALQSPLTRRLALDILSSIRISETTGDKLMVVRQLFEEMSAMKSLGEDSWREDLSQLLDNVLRDVDALDLLKTVMATHDASEVRRAALERFLIVRGRGVAQSLDLQDLSWIARLVIDPATSTAIQQLLASSTINDNLQQLLPTTLEFAKTYVETLPELHRQYLDILRQTRTYNEMWTLIPTAIPDPRIRGDLRTLVRLEPPLDFLVDEIAGAPSSMERGEGMRLLATRLDLEGHLRNPSASFLILVIDALHDPDLRDAAVRILSSTTIDHPLLKNRLVRALVLLHQADPIISTTDGIEAYLDGLLLQRGNINNEASALREIVVNGEASDTVRIVALQRLVGLDEFHAGPERSQINDKLSKILNDLRLDGTLAQQVISVAPPAERGKWQELWRFIDAHHTLRNARPNDLLQRLVNMHAKPGALVSLLADGTIDSTLRHEILLLLAEANDLTHQFNSELGAIRELVRAAADPSEADLANRIIAKFNDDPTVIRLTRETALLEFPSLLAGPSESQSVADILGDTQTEFVIDRALDRLETSSTLPSVKLTPASAKALLRAVQNPARRARALHVLQHAGYQDRQLQVGVLEALLHEKLSADISTDRTYAYDLSQFFSEMVRSSEVTRLLWSVIGESLDHRVRLEALYWLSQPPQRASLGVYGDVARVAVETSLITPVLFDQWRVPQGTRELSLLGVSGASDGRFRLIPDRFGNSAWTAIVLLNRPEQLRDGEMLEIELENSPQALIGREFSVNLGTTVRDPAIQFDFKGVLLSAKNTLQVRVPKGFVTRAISIRVRASLPPAINLEMPRARIRAVRVQPAGRLAIDRKSIPTGVLARAA